jgi:hypothetical protein
MAMHTKQAPYRSYVVVARVPRGSVTDALYWDTEDPYHYVRLQTAASRDEYHELIVGGEDHKTGQESDMEGASGISSDGRASAFRTSSTSRITGPGRCWSPRICSRSSAGIRAMRTSTSARATRGWG